MDSCLYGRYDANYERISRELLQKRDPGRILSDSVAGDRHLHGDAVTRIRTAGGFTLFYKPRDCRSTELCADLTKLLFGKRMAPEQITGEGYAFQKAVKEKLPETELQKKRYYEDLGRLTALFYALGSTDMHNGNILCEGSLPVVIDTETLLAGKAEGFAGNGEFSLDYGEIFPDYQTNAGESMVLPRFYGYMQTSPLTAGAGCRPESCEPFFIRGFQDGYGKILERRDEIMSILEQYKDAPFRVVLRSTRYYSVKIRQYQKAKDDAERESVLKSLEKGLAGAELLRWAPVLVWERECVCEEDVPYFCFRAAERHLYKDTDSPALIPDFLTVSPIEYAAWRMERMGERDLTVQTAYIRAGLKHMDGWEQPAGEDPGKQQGQGVLSVREAVEEVEESIRSLWEERIPLSQGCCLWHTPMVRGKVGCLFGLSEGFSGTAVFIHACTRSALITGEAARLAGNLKAACYQNLAVFGEYLLEAYPKPPKERIISRRFNGDFGFADGLSGFLWALRLFREEDPKRTDRMLEGFGPWQIEDAGEEFKALLNHIRPGTMTDCLENGNAARAAALLLKAGPEDGTVPLAQDKSLSAERIREAGVLLNSMVSLKKERGCYRIFPKGRRSYFLPAFLRGTTGIAYVLLCYAEACQALTGCLDFGRL